MDILFKIIGVFGLILIIIGIVVSNRKYRDILYAFGGACLCVYSIYLGDAIFIILQAIFVIVALYDLLKKKRVAPLKNQ